MIYLTIKYPYNYKINKILLGPYDKGQENFSRYKIPYRFEHTTRIFLRIISHKIALVHSVKMKITVLKENVKFDALKLFICTKS